MTGVSNSATTGLASALRAVCERRLPVALDLLRQMVEINSFTLNPAGVNQLAALTAHHFASLGFTAESVGSENPAYGRHLVLSRPGTGPATVALMSHLDTVYTSEEERANDFHWRVEGDRLYGPGTVDIKAGTTLAHLICAALEECAPDLFHQVNWLFLLNSAEEVPSADFGRLCRERIPRTDAAALVLEGGAWTAETHAVVTARKGRALFRVNVQGRSAHAGNNHERGANAIVQLSHLVQRIEALTDHSRELTFNVGVISGGTVVNRVPDAAWAEVEMRAFDPDVYARGVAAIRQLEHQVAVRSLDDDWACRVQVELVSETPPWPVNPATEKLFACCQQAGREAGFRVVRQNRGGVSDGNHIWDHVPTLDGLGPCGEHAHCAQRDPATNKDQEYVEASSFVPRAVLAALTIRAWLAPHAAR